MTFPAGRTQAHRKRTGRRGDAAAWVERGAEMEDGRSSARGRGDGGQGATDVDQVVGDDTQADPALVERSRSMPWRA